MNERIMLNERIKFIEGIMLNKNTRDSWNYVPPILFPSFAKRIATQMLVTEKLSGRNDFVLRGFVYDSIRPSKKLPVQR